MPLTIRNQRISEQEASSLSHAVERDLQERGNIDAELPAIVPAADDPGAVKPHTVSEIVREVPEVSKKAVPDNWVEKIRKYIPAEVLVGWATTKQLLDVLFEGAVDTPGEITTFTVVWASFVIGVAIWVFWSLRRERLVVARDADLTLTDMLTHSTVSAFAFALYTMSMGPHFALLQSQFQIPNIMPMLVMFVFPMVVGVLGDTYIKKPASLPLPAVERDSHPIKDD